MSSPFEECIEVTPYCPVEATTYGYTPNLPGNTILLAVFGICALLQLFLGIRGRLRAFTAVVTIGAILETLGYGGRIMMHQNPWDDAGFKLQIVCLILAPSFLAAGLYLTLKHLVRSLDVANSRLPPRLYTWIFITCDAVSIVVQAVGGGLAASGGDSELGGDIMIAGIAVQVATMGVCILLAFDFGIRTYLNRERNNLEASKPTALVDRRFRFFLACFSLAFLAIFVRCIYRLPEMAGGWGNPLMRNEKEFLILDGAMIALAVILMTVAHPAIFFPQMDPKNERTSEKELDDFTKREAS